MKKLLMGLVALGIPGLLFAGNLMYTPEAEAEALPLGPEACTYTYYEDETYTNVVLVLNCSCSNPACYSTEDVTPFYTADCYAC
ncbi:hypothetical protein [Vitiosangium sp. GDMCC 1.1324]|uniref:hypothetical protein n=1 Tax=Vitiosangium sp. (strain GDMCC 1.1324) TaxID=2138576 RepID=UPI000D37ABED|nr:hypothetical protein [Vitiosangium sp. GDMCC 1.1324]PTL85042.1 hypothetical protein DAT35_08360 [Vitiosangium sp. GDMCC 1.1324]